MSKGEELAALLRGGRSAARLTQWDVAVGVGLKQVVSVSRYENAKAIPEPPVFEKLIAAYGLDADSAWMLWGLAYAERARRGLEALGG